MPSKIGSLVLRASALLMAIVQPAAAQELSIPNRGTLTFTLPPQWKEVRRITPKDLPPTVELERSPGFPLNVFKVDKLYTEDPNVRVISHDDGAGHGHATGAWFIFLKSAIPGRRAPAGSPR